MRVQLLGTGSADGWPNPWCECPSCTWARCEPSRQRTHTSALVDGTLLVDCGPDVPRAASRAGVSLAAVQTLLLTHAHADHTGPAVLPWRGWAGTPGRLQVAGPAPALAACREWVLPDEVEWLELGHGDEVVLASGHPVTALPARHASDALGPANLYAVGDDGSRLLVGWDTAAPLADEVIAAGPYDLALVECTHGDGPSVGEHHTLADLAATVAQLRPAMAGAGRTVATHLGHGNPPGTELGEHLAALGVELHPDGSVVSGPRRVLVTGGARSGKSRFAESLLGGLVTYVATGGHRDGDPTWAHRVAEHRARRPASWRTVETLDVAGQLGGTTPVLVDCLTLWLARSSFTDEGDPLQVDTEGLLAALAGATATVVVVTNEVGSGVVPAHASGVAFADALGSLNARVAAVCDEVWHCVAGVPTRLR